MTSESNQSGNTGKKVMTYRDLQKILANMTDHQLDCDVQVFPELLQDNFEASVIFGSEDFTDSDQPIIIGLA